MYLNPMQEALALILEQSFINNLGWLQLRRHAVGLHETAVPEPGGWSPGGQRPGPVHSRDGRPPAVLQRRHIRESNPLLCRHVAGTAIQSLVNPGTGH